MNRILSWWDKNILFILTVALMVFIPLYPKIPLFSFIEEYIVRARLEDVLVGIAFIVWLVQLGRKKIKLDFPLTKIIGAYLAVGFLSIVTNVLFTGWIPMQGIHIGKALLHLARYTEYFFLGFLVFSACQNKKQLKIIVGVLFGVLLTLTIYGWGQRYFYWPVFSTMNREFSKGMVLYLTPHARVNATFAGHYDLAAYLVLVLPITLAVALKQKLWWQKALLLTIHFGGLWLMIVAASRISFFAMLPGIALVLWLIIAEAETWKKRLGRGLKWGGLYLVVLGFLLLGWGDDVTTRLVRSLRPIDAVYQPVFRAHEDFKIWRNSIDIAELLDIKPPENGMGVDLAALELESVMLLSDTQPVATRPSDVFVDIPDLVATEGGMVERPRTWSACALKYDLSTCIRLDALWPWAIEGLERNPLFGSSYGALNKRYAEDWTEADGTDNNYLRTLGETGILGFVFFYGALAMASVVAIRWWKQSKEGLEKWWTLGFMAAMVGILLNAIFIDVFAASKVAFMVWAFVGLMYSIKKRL